MEIKFKKLFEFEGETHNGITLNIDSLTGSQVLEAERRYLMLRPENAGNPAKEFSKEYQMIVASIASGKPIEFFRALPFHELTKITVAVQNFLISGETDET